MTIAKAGADLGNPPNSVLFMFSLFFIRSCVYVYFVSCDATYNARFIRIDTFGLYISAIVSSAWNETIQMSLVLFVYGSTCHLTPTKVTGVTCLRVDLSSYTNKSHWCYFSTGRLVILHQQMSLVLLVYGSTCHLTPTKFTGVICLRVDLSSYTNKIHWCYLSTGRLVILHQQKSLVLLVYGSTCHLTPTKVTGVTCLRVDLSSYTNKCHWCYLSTGRLVILHQQKSLVLLVCGSTCHLTPTKVTGVTCLRVDLSSYTNKCHWCYLSTGRLVILHQQKSLVLFVYGSTCHLTPTKVTGVTCLRVDLSSYTNKCHWCYLSTGRLVILHQQKSLVLLVCGSTCHLTPTKVTGVTCLRVDLSSYTNKSHWCYLSTGRLVILHQQMSLVLLVYGSTCHLTPTKVTGVTCLRIDLSSYTNKSHWCYLSTGRLVILHQQKSLVLLVYGSTCHLTPTNVTGVTCLRVDLSSYTNKSHWCYLSTGRLVILHQQMSLVLLVYGSTCHLTPTKVTGVTCLRIDLSSYTNKSHWCYLSTGRLVILHQQMSLVLLVYGSTCHLTPTKVTGVTCLRVDLSSYTNKCHWCYLSTGRLVILHQQKSLVLLVCGSTCHLTPTKVTGVTCLRVDLSSYTNKSKYICTFVYS